MDGLMSVLVATEYAGYTVKEWNIVQFSKLSRVLSAIAKDLKSRNVQWEGFSEILAKEEKEGLVGMSDSLLELLSPFVEHAPIILSVSCNADVKKLETLSYTDGIILLVLVLKANLEHLNRFFGTLVAQREPETVTTPSI